MAIRWWFKKRSTWEGVDLMNLVPETVREAETDPETEMVTLLIPRYSSWPLNRLIQPYLGPEKKYLRVPLEARGSFLWAKIDGKLSIGDLVPDFENKFPTDNSDVPQRLASFLFQMFQNKFIRFLNHPK